MPVPPQPHEEDRQWTGHLVKHLGMLGNEAARVHMHGEE